MRLVFLRVSRHARFVAAIEAQRIGGPAPDGDSQNVHCGVTAAEHHHTFAPHIDRLVGLRGSASG